jgi:fido (protein-threonine AMPylation protein)
VPRQLLVRASSARNQITNLPHNTSLLDIRAALPEKREVVEQEGLRLFSLCSALVAVPAGFYVQNPTDARIALSMIRDASDVLALLLDGGHSVVASRLAGAFRNIARGGIADDILAGMRSAGYTVRESDPFETQSPLSLPERERSPYVNRVRLMWQAMREPILQVFPDSPGLPRDIDAYLKKVSDTYVLDAYHSLSIEGYRVSAELIDRVRGGTWDPELNENDRKSRDALAARGYWQAYQAVEESVRRILRGENPGDVADQDHRIWYRELFGPSVTAGLLKPSDLAGYRNGPVYIRQSMHVPPRDEAVRDIMPAFFELLREEDEPAVRVVLGHFIFVYTHPYMDGNGRMGRFLMNTMLASGGYPWTVLPVGERAEYMAALEDASVRQNIKPFAEFLSRLVKDSMKGKMPSVPST